MADIVLYTWTTPNGRKVSICLEELGLAYDVVAIDTKTGAQKAPDYVRLNPNGRIPTIVDRAAGDFAVFESGAILIYLAEREGRLLPTDAKGRSRVIQWLMFQMGGIGPMQGQMNVFFRYFPEHLPAVISRYQNEVRRLFGVMDARLAEAEYLAGDYSIADIACYPWVAQHGWGGIETLEPWPSLSRWLDRLGDRPAVARGMAVPAIPRSDADRIATGHATVMR